MEEWFSLCKQNQVSWVSRAKTSCPSYCKRKQRTVILFLWHWALSRDPRLFQPITYFCFSSVLTWYHVSQDRSLYTWEWRWIRVDVLRFDTEVRLLCSLQADTLAKWEIRGAERHMRGRCVLVHFHIGLKRQKGQLVRSSTFHLKSPDGLFLLENWCATV